MDRGAQRPPPRPSPASGRGGAVPSPQSHSPATPNSSSPARGGGQGGGLPGRIEGLIADTLALWGVTADIHPMTDGLNITPPDGATLTIAHTPTGWTIRRRDDTLPPDLCPVHPTVLGLLRDLRAELAPDHPRARLIVAPAPAEA